MEKIQRNAKAYAKLLDVEYILYLGYKGNCKKVILRFSKENFQHLEGIGQLTDLVFHQIRGADVFKKALVGAFIDNNELVFNYIQKKMKGSKIQAKMFLYKDVSGKDIYLFLDSSSDDEIYFPRSFVVAPDVDYKTGQYKYTVLWKEKRNRTTGESEVLSRFKEFDPEKVSA